jgi:hypothetical protein
MIRHRCAVCHHWQETSEHLAGMTMPCRECGEQLQVPTQSASDYDRSGGHVLRVAPAETATAVVEEEITDQLERVLPRLVPHSLVGRLIAFGGLLIVLLAVTVPLAYWLAGTSAWLLVLCVTGIALVVAAVGGAVYAVLRKMGQPFPAIPGPVWALLGVFGVAWAAGLVVDLVCLPATVHVENYSGKSVALTVDGQAWTTAGDKTTQSLRLRQGSHLVIVRDLNGNHLDEFQIQVESGRATYVLNVLGAQVYAQGKVTYGPHVTGSNAVSVATTEPEKRVKDKWFEVRADYLFDEAPANLPVALAAGVGSRTERTYLVRREPKVTVR